VLPRLHVVTDDEVLARDDFTARARDVFAAGDWRVALHLRGPGTPGARLYQLAAELVWASRDAGSLLLVNDRIDVALAAEADGVHLRERSLPPAEARRLLPAGRLVGASVHHEDDARARAPDVDYLVAGTVFASPSHPGRKGSGPALLVRVGAVVGVPVLAIGGITPERVAEVRAAGAYGVAVLSGVWGADEPAWAVAGYLERLI
jgi:thiamine-phosphate diphosphorylase